MGHQRTYAFRAVIALLMACSIDYTCAADSTHPPVAPALSPSSDASWSQVFDSTVPLADRQRILTNLEADATQSNDPHALYMLGSLYHMGQHAPGSPVQENPQKATLYFGNAAIRGSVLAMAKMAELELAAGQYREAMNWAQIYAHYALMSKRDSQSRNAYAAELVQRVQDHISESQMTAIMKDVNSFVATYDTEIKVGIAGEAILNHLHPTSVRNHFKPALDDRLPDSGIADFIVAFKPDGSVANVQLLDAVPRIDVVATLREYAEKMTVTPVPDGGDHALRYAWIPTMLNDRRYRIATKH
ncbi:sel1 repeat family protein [Dyella caseinilytica]|uniref:Sel1 repeat family protein n=1 Tax=Dyella caseinilytica TaxID=1849581 RepID=A0ABX7GR92_9GAMM|nr:sel1 repeat family protein [Dyella caseinilytica]QRN52942.1 sel1 repeat family protein [Dyella caseinilytica]